MTLTPLPPMRTLLLRSAGTMRRRADAGAPSFPPPARYAAEALPADWLKAYHAYYGGFRSPVPLTALYPLAQRSHLALMLNGDFPYAVPGMIHLSNDQRAIAPIDPAAPYELAVTVNPYAMPDAPTWTCLAFDTALVQAGTLVATCQSVYLAKRSGRRGAAPEAPEGRPVPSIEEPWTLTASEGRRYAALSGDYNPIHLSPWTSRFFGFEQPILHGMNAMGLAIATLERRMEAAVTGGQVAFRRAVPLPSEVTLVGWRDEAGTTCFQVRPATGEAPHMTGTLSVAVRPSLES